ncbi:hypothetical protein D5086_005365 [Populus alba]|uniref:Uncharacterized protein n=1 Tax=Populus alba TaxID=43335 RepID=A0ACC4CTD3_POPAL
MASRWRITGNKGRCYDFLIDFNAHRRRNSQHFWNCHIFVFTSRNSNLRTGFQRRNRIYKEEQRKLRAASKKADGEVPDIVSTAEILHFLLAELFVTSYSTLQKKNIAA